MLSLKKGESYLWRFKVIDEANYINDLITDFKKLHNENKPLSISSPNDDLNLNFRKFEKDRITLDCEIRGFLISEGIVTLPELYTLNSSIIPFIRKLTLLNNAD